MGYVLQPLTISSEKYSASPWPITNSDNITLDELGPVWRRGERLTKAPGACRQICDRVSVEARQPEEWVWFCGQADADKGVLGLFIYLCFPVVHFILLGDREVGHDSALAIKELDLGTSFDEAVRNFQFGFKLPSRDPFLLDYQILREGYVGHDGLRGVGLHKGYGDAESKQVSRKASVITSQEWCLFTFGSQVFCPL